MNDNLKYVESKKGKGLVSKLKQLADNAGRSLNNYVEQIFKKHVNEEGKYKNPNLSGNIAEHNETQE